MKRHNMASAFVNPEYYDRYDNSCDYGGYDSHEDQATKKRKLMNMSVCVDHLRGYCPVGARCPKAHSDQVHSLDERETMAKAKFCHDFQNRGMCNRGTCRFLHVTRREEDEFLLTGVIPQSVFERKHGTTAGPDDSSYSSFGGDNGRGRSGGGGPRGGGGGYGRRPPSDYYSPYDNYIGYPSPYNYSNWSEWDVPQRRPPSGSSRQGGGGGGGGGRSSSMQIRSISQALTYSNYCIDFLKGSCGKGTGCRLTHVRVVEDMDDREAIVKSIFCHDFQNKRCPRLHCKYIHANFDEQKVFIEDGFFSESLCERNQAKLFFCDICIDFLRKQCLRGSNCQYRHVTCVEDDKERVCLSRSIFCHDHQDGGCHRPVCKLMHTSRDDEVYFMDTGYLPEHLRSEVGGGGGGGKGGGGGGGRGGGGGTYNASLEALATAVCRDYVKGVCNRGSSCKFYHPPDSEVKKLVEYLNSKSGRGPSSSNGPSNEEFEKLKTENEKIKQENSDLKQRIQQLEQLLADACHCITLAVGDQNPAIQPLLQSISGMAPESSLANQTQV